MAWWFRRVVKHGVEASTADVAARGWVVALLLGAAPVAVFAACGQNVDDARGASDQANHLGWPVGGALLGGAAELARRRKQRFVNGIDTASVDPTPLVNDPPLTMVDVPIIAALAAAIAAVAALVVALAFLPEICAALIAWHTRAVALLGTLTKAARDNAPNLPALTADAEALLLEYRPLTEGVKAQVQQLGMAAEGALAEAAVIVSEVGVDKLAGKDAAVIRAALQRVAASGGSFMDQVFALGEATASLIPAGQVHNIGTVAGREVYGSLVSGTGIVELNGVTMLVKMRGGELVQILGRFIP